MQAHLIAVVGPTAAGKSELSLRLARELDAEVINADSMQLYRGMDIGTGKLGLAEQGGVPHHLLDIWDVTEPASVSEYQRLARDAIDDVLSRGRTPLLVGGSGLYIRAAIDNLEFPGTDPALRARLEDELVAVGSSALHARLAVADPAAAAAILPSNGRRIVRALEVIELSGRPFSATLPEYSAVMPTTQLGLEVPRPELDRRIAERVRRMWRDGLVDEVRALVGSGESGGAEQGGHSAGRGAPPNPRWPSAPRTGLRAGRTASRALGYAQVLRFLDGEWTQEQAREETIAATRRFARRQESWFRRDPRVRWLPAGEPVPTAVALAAIADEVRVAG